jgi:hypothetical protein
VIGYYDNIQLPECKFEGENTIYAPACGLAEGNFSMAFESIDPSEPGIQSAQNETFIDANGRKRVEFAIRKTHFFGLETYLLPRLGLIAAVNKLVLVEDYFKPNRHAGEEELVLLRPVYPWFQERRTRVVTQRHMLFWTRRVSQTFSVDGSPTRYEDLLQRANNYTGRADSPPAGLKEAMLTYWSQFKPRE